VSFKSQLFAGISLAFVGALGFFTVADDFRHFGEISVAGGLLLAGISFIFIAYKPSFKSTLALQWFSIGILIGLVIGVAFDATAIGFVSGAVIGALLARAFRTKVVSTSGAAT
jgi:hypothetical protein